MNQYLLYYQMNKDIKFYIISEICMYAYIIWAIESPSQSECIPTTEKKKQLILQQRHHQ